MWYKLVILAFFFKVSYQIPIALEDDGLDGHFTPLHLNAQDDAISVNISDAIATGKSVYRTIANSLFRKLENMLKNVQNSAESVLNNATKTVEAQKEKHLREISELQKIAENLGVDINKCFGNKLDIIQAMGKQTTEEVRQFIKDKVDEPVRIIREAIDSGRQVLVHYEEMETNIMDCRYIGLCILEVVVGTAVDIIRLSNELPRRLFPKAVTLTNEIIPDLQTSAANVTGRFEAKGAEIIVNITKCVYKKKQSNLLLL